MYLAFPVTQIRNHIAQIFQGSAYFKCSVPLSHCVLIFNCRKHGFQTSNK